MNFNAPKSQSPPACSPIYSSSKFSPLFLIFFIIAAEALYPGLNDSGGECGVPYQSRYPMPKTSFGRVLFTARTLTLIVTPIQTLPSISSPILCKNYANTHLKLEL